MKLYTGLYPGFLFGLALLQRWKEPFLKSSSRENGHCKIIPSQHLLKNFNSHVWWLFSRQFHYGSHGSIHVGKNFYRNSINIFFSSDDPIIASSFLNHTYYLAVSLLSDLMSKNLLLVLLEAHFLKNIYFSINNLHSINNVWIDNLPLILKHNYMHLLIQTYVEFLLVDANYSFFYFHN